MYKHGCRRSSRRQWSHRHHRIQETCTDTASSHHLLYFLSHHQVNSNCGETYLPASDITATYQFHFDELPTLLFFAHSVFRRCCSLLYVVPLSLRSKLYCYLVSSPVVLIIITSSMSSFSSRNDDFRRSLIRERRKRAVLSGYLAGQTIGTTAYVLSVGRNFSPRAAVGSGAFLGFCLAVGAFFQTL